MSRSDGFTMLEAMLSLAIVALIATISIRAYTRGNPGLEYRVKIGEVIADARSARRSAVQTGKTIRFKPDAQPCDLEAELLFFSDGSAGQADVCLLITDRPTVFRTVGLTGALEVVE